MHKLSNVRMPKRLDFAIRLAENAWETTSSRELPCDLFSLSSSS